MQTLGFGTGHIEKASRRHSKILSLMESEAIFMLNLQIWSGRKFFFSVDNLEKLENHFFGWFVDIILHNYDNPEYTIMYLPVFHSNLS